MICIHSGIACFLVLCVFVLTCVRFVQCKSPNAELLTRALASIEKDRGETCCENDDNHPKSDDNSTAKRGFDASAQAKA